MSNFKFSASLAVVAAGIVFEGFASPASAIWPPKKPAPVASYNQGFVEGQLIANGVPVQTGVWSKPEALGISQGYNNQLQVNAAQQAAAQAENIRQLDRFSIGYNTREIERLQQRLESSPGSRLRGYYEWKVRRDEAKIVGAKARLGVE